MSIFLHTTEALKQPYPSAHESVLLRVVGIPGHVPHSEWFSVLFIEGTSQNLKWPLSMYFHALNMNSLNKK